ncbi:hypothetical protein LINPERPRIM_LOCUS22310 [Linum perenne]
MFDEHNALAKISRFVRDRLDAGVVQNVKIRLFANRSGQGREYDLPSANELAGLIIDETGKDTFSLDIIIQHQSNELERITFYHPSLMALQYPILFPYGEADWHANIMYVVPYNRYLLLRFDAHINVEFCNKSRAIKYLFKYINKPPDRDEIKAFMDCRYLTAGEACWRIFKFDLYTNTPAVMRLSYHLPGQQPVYSNTRLRLEELVEVELAHTSMLLEWMKLNAYYPGARQYTFVEFPQHFVWNREAKAWKPRKNKQCIGSLYYCHPSSQEVFYLRMLLHTVKGCTSFEDIRTVNGKTYDSFKQTCNAHGFLTDDGEWNHCLEEVSFTATAREMRKLFVTKLLYCQVSDVKSLWEKNWTLLSDDILFSRRQELRLPNLELSIEETKILCLLQLQNILRGFGKTLADIQGLPAPPVDSTLHLSNSLLAEEMNYDCAALQAQFQSNFMKLNTEQKAAYNQIMESVETNGHQLFFIDGYGGTGKTFLWQVISMKLRADKKVVYV